MDDAVMIITMNMICSFSLPFSCLPWRDSLLEKRIGEMGQWVL